MKKVKNDDGPHHLGSFIKMTSMQARWLDHLTWQSLPRLVCTPVIQRHRLLSGKKWSREERDERLGLSWTTSFWAAWVTHPWKSRKSRDTVDTSSGFKGCLETEPGLENNRPQLARSTAFALTSRGLAIEHEKHQNPPMMLFNFKWIRYAFFSTSNLPFV